MAFNPTEKWIECILLCKVSPFLQFPACMTYTEHISEMPVVNSTRNHWNVHHVLVHVYHRITMNYCWFKVTFHHVQGHTDIIDLNKKTTDKNISQKWLYLILVLGTHLPYSSTKSPLYHNVCYGLNHVNPPIFYASTWSKTTIFTYGFVSEQAIQKETLVSHHFHVWIFICIYIDIYIYVYIYIDIV